MPEWISTGQLPGISTVYTLCVYDDNLYAGGRDSEVFRYDGDNNWVSVGTIGGPHVYHLFVFDGSLYASSRHGNIYRYLGGSSWLTISFTSDTTYRCYNLCDFNNKLHISTFAESVYRDDGVTPWTTIATSSNPFLWGTYPAWLLPFDGALYAGQGGGYSGYCRIYKYITNLNWVVIGTIPVPPTGYCGLWKAIEHDGDVFWGTGDPGKVYKGIDASIDLGTVGSNDRICALCYFDSKLWAAGQGDSHTYFYDTEWHDSGVLGGTIWDLCIYEGYLYAATTNGGRVYRYSEPEAVPKGSGSALPIFATILSS